MLIRQDWEVCVPTDKVDAASELLKSEEAYETYPPGPPQIGSLLHIFPRFKISGKSPCFVIVLSDNVHLDGNALKIERNLNGLPYPTLETFAQSLPERNDLVSLTDLIDGMDLTDKWGLENLQLEGENDVAWAVKKNEKICSSVPEGGVVFMLELSTKPICKKEIAHEIANSKEERIGIECPKEVYVTRFRCRGQADPRVIEIDMA
jgi:hypothetical protein